MHKPRKRSWLHHLKRRHQLHGWRQLARGLIKGEITLPQMERLAGQSARNVLRTAAYLSTRASQAPPALVAQAINEALAPALAGTNIPRPRLATPLQSAPRAVATVPAAPVAEPPAAPPARPRPRLRSVGARPPRQAAEAAPAAETAEAAAEKPARPAVASRPARRPRTTRAAQGQPAPAPETPAAERPAPPTPRRTARRAPATPPPARTPE